MMTNQPNVNVQPTDATQTVKGILSTHANSFGHPVYFGNEPSIETILGKKHLVFVTEITTTTKLIFESTVPFTQFDQHSLWYAILNMHAMGTFDLDLSFILVKPLMVPGKILIQYCSDPNGTFDDKWRSFKREWDTSVVTSLDFPITSLQLGEQRILNSSHGFPSENPADPNGGAGYLLGFKPMQELWSFGKMKMEMITPLMPGSVYPDSYTLLMFLQFKNVALSVPRSYLCPESNTIIPKYTETKGKFQTPKKTTPPKDTKQTTPTNPSPPKPPKMPASKSSGKPHPGTKPGSATV